MVERGFHAYLLATTGLTALVGNRIYPDKSVQGDQFPYLCYSRQSTDRWRTLGGPCNVSVARIAVDCWGITRGQAKAVAEAVRTADGGTAPRRLDGFRGDWAYNGGGYFVQSVTVSDDVDDFAAPIHGDDVGAKSTTVFVDVCFNEP